MKRFALQRSLVVSLIVLLAGLLQIAHAQSGVGIDVANPLEMLDVDGAIKIGTDFTNTTGAPVGGAGTIRWNGTNFEGWDGTQWVQFGSSGFSNLLQDADTDTKVQVEANADEDKIRLETQGALRMVVDEDGQVGIGANTDPRHLLDIGYSLNPMLNTNTVDVSELSIRVRNGSTDNGQGTGIGFATGGPNLMGAAIVHERRGTNSLGSLHFATKPDQGNGTDLPIRMTIASDGNLGVGSIDPEEKLHVEGSVRMVDGNQASGYIPVSDANGTMIWTDPTSIATAADGDGDSANEIQALSISGNDVSLSNGGGTVTIPLQNELADDDSDTKIQVEESPDEDIIRFDMAGTEFFRMDSGRLEVVNTGLSVFIGENAGASDNLANNRNVYIGSNAGSAGTTANHNIAMGNNSLVANTAGSANIVMGRQSGRQVQLDFNIGIGNFSLFNGDSASRNVAIGNYSMRSADNTDLNVAIGQSSLYSLGGSSFSSPADYNTAVGAFTSFSMQTGSENTMLGSLSGYNATGSSNVFVGYRSGYNETGSNKLYIDNSSTTTPLIYGEFDNDLLRVNGTLNVNNAYSLPTADGTNGYLMTTDGSGAVSWTDPATITTADDGDWLENGNDLYNGNTGNVGIGENTPLTKLHISEADGQQLMLSREDVTIQAGDQLGAIGFDGSDGNTPDDIKEASAAIIAVATENQGSGDKGGALTFWTSPDNQDDDTDGFERLRIDSDGSVGIGTSNPNFDLQLHDDDGVDSWMQFTNAATGSASADGLFVGVNHLQDAAFINREATDMIFYTDNTERLRIETNGNLNTNNNWISGDGDSEGLMVDDNGNVGVGSTAPVTKLDVNGSGWFRESSGGLASTAGKGIRVGFDAPTDAGLLFAYDYANGTGKDLALQSNGGNVGIGITSPQNDLHIHDSSSDNAWLHLTQASTGTNNTDGFIIGVNSSEQAVLLNREATDMLFFTSNTERLRIETNGNLNTNNNWISGDGNAEGLMVDDNGNVGVGTSSPSSNLDVNGNSSGSTSLTLRSGNSLSGFNSTQIRLGFDGTSDYSHIIKSRHNGSADDRNAIDFYVWDFGGDGVSDEGSKHVMTLDGYGGGSLGVGTPTPDATLDVVGNFQLADGSQGDEKILQSDANGFASWETVRSGTTNGSANIGNLRMQWGTATSTTDNSQSFTLSGFSQVFNVQITRMEDNPNRPMGLTSFNSSSFTINRSNDISGNVNFTWMAIGAPQ